MVCDHLQDLSRPQIHQNKHIFTVLLFLLFPKLLSWFLFLIFGGNTCYKANLCYDQSYKVKINATLLICSNIQHI